MAMRVHAHSIGAYAFTLLEAINLLFHIDQMASSKQGKTIQAKSWKCHKFKKLQGDLVKWHKTPTNHIKDMKVAHKEWRVPGIREMTDQLGCCMFARAILNPNPMPTRNQTPPCLSCVNVGQPLTIRTPETSSSNDAKPAMPTKQNPFFSLEDSARAKNWANYTRTQQMTTPPTA
jgi:hypothetical protein